MKHILKLTREIIISIFYFIQWLLLRLLKMNFSKCKRESAKPKPIRILGNGPSLNKILNNTCKEQIYDYCCVNFSPLSDSFFQIKPQYLILVDPAFFGVPNDKIEKLFQNIQSVDWNMTLIIPYYAKQQIQQRLKINKNIKFSVFPGGLEPEMRIKSLRYFIFKHGFAGPPAQNVVVAAIYQMIMAGYKTIELYGVEHSWLHQIIVNDKNELCQADYHFYDTEKPAMKPWVAFGQQLLLHELLGMLSITFGAYHDLKEFAKRLGGITINNCTPNSFIDAFDRKL